MTGNDPGKEPGSADEPGKVAGGDDPSPESRPEGGDEEQSEVAGSSAKAEGFLPPGRKAAAPEPLRRGLSSIERSRAARNRLARPPLKVIAWFALVIAVAMALYWQRSSTTLDKDRQALLNRQREYEAQIGTPVWYPAREKMEAFVLELGKTAEPEVIEKAELAKFDFQSLPGVYLRLRVDQAGNVEDVRKGALGSLKDAFTGCLMKTPGESPVAGKECQNSSECETGALCNEYLHCAKPVQPYNMRLAYRSLHVFTPAWVREVQDADNDLRLRALTLSFDEAARVDLPVAINMLTEAKFFLVVLDERPPPAPQTPEEKAAGAVRVEDVDAIEGVTTPSRVGLWRLSDGKLLLRLRREVKGALMGAQPLEDPTVAAARTRQAQSCELARVVRCEVGDPNLDCSAR